MDNSFGSELAHNYSIYGLKLQVNQLLPGLSTTSFFSSPDVRVDIMSGEESQLPSPDVKAVSSGFQQVQADHNRTYFHLWFRGDGQLNFEIDEAASHIAARWDRSVLEEVTGLLLGPVLACTLRLRGVLCLHACVIAINGQAIAIVGESGAGKSTTAAALASRGFAVVSDDIAALDYQNQYWQVHPGYPRLRLWPETIRKLYGPETELAPIFSFSEKRFIDLAPHHPLSGSQSSQWTFQDQPLPLAAIYVLGKRQTDILEPMIEPIPASEAVLTLMAHRSASHLFKPSPQQQKQEFLGLSQVASIIPVRRVTHSNCWEALPQLCAAIIEDVLTANNDAI